MSGVNDHVRLENNETMIHHLREKIRKLEHDLQESTGLIAEQTQALNTKYEHHKNNDRVNKIQQRQIEILNKKLSDEIAKEELYKQQIEKLQTSLQKAQSSPSLSHHSKLPACNSPDERKCDKHTEEIIKLQTQIEHLMKEKHHAVEQFQTQIQKLKTTHESQVKEIKQIIETLKIKKNGEVMKWADLSVELTEMKRLKEEQCIELEALKNQINRPLTKIGGNTKINNYEDNIKNLEQHEKVYTFLADEEENTKANLDTNAKKNLSQQDWHNLILEKTQMQKSMAKIEEQTAQYKKLLESVHQEFQQYKQVSAIRVAFCFELCVKNTITFPTANEIAQLKQKTITQQETISTLRNEQLLLQQHLCQLKQDNQSLLANCESQSRRDKANHKQFQNIHNDGDEELSAILASDDQQISYANFVNSQKVKQMQDTITHQNAQIKILTTTLEALQNIGKSLHGQNTNQATIVKLSSQLTSLQELQLLQSKYEQEMRIRKAFETKYQENRKETVSLEQMTQYLKDENNRLGQELLKSTEESSKLNNTIFVLQNDLKNLEMKMECVTKHNYIIQNELDVLSKKHFDHLSKISQDKTAKGIPEYLVSKEAGDTGTTMGASDHPCWRRLTSFISATKKIYNEDEHQVMDHIIDCVSEYSSELTKWQKKCDYYVWFTHLKNTECNQLQTQVFHLQSSVEILRKFCLSLQNDWKNALCNPALTNNKNCKIAVQQKNEMLQLHQKLSKAKAQNALLQAQLIEYKKDIEIIKTNEKIRLSKENSQIKEYRERFKEELKELLQDKDRTLKDYLQTHLKEVRKQIFFYEPFLLFVENCVEATTQEFFEFANELMAMKYVQQDLSNELRQAYQEIEDLKESNMQLTESLQSTQSTLKTWHPSGCSDNNFTEIDFRKFEELEKENEQLKKEVNEYKHTNQSLQQEILLFQKEIKYLKEWNENESKQYHEELNNLRKQMMDEREKLATNYNEQLSTVHEQSKKQVEKHQNTIQSLTNKLNKILCTQNHQCDKKEKDTDISTLYENQAHQLQKTNTHLQTMKMRISQLEFELADTQREKEAQKMVVEHLQETIHLMYPNVYNDNINNPQTISSRQVIQVLAKELVKSRKEQSELLVKLRVCTQNQAELQEVIVAKEKRMQEVKEQMKIGSSAGESGNKRLSSKKVVHLNESCVGSSSRAHNYEEIMLDMTKKDAEIRHLKKKLSLEQTKVNTLYDLQELQVFFFLCAHDLFYNNYLFAIDAHTQKEIGRQNSGVVEMPRPSCKLEDQSVKDSETKKKEEINQQLLTQMKHSIPDLMGHGGITNLEQATQLSKQFDFLAKTLSSHLKKMDKFLHQSSLQTHKASNHTISLRLKKIQETLKTEWIHISAISDQIHSSLGNVEHALMPVIREYRTLHEKHLQQSMHFVK
ncbi:hypothetical protein RFI_21669 [Reticulomyxa filosa]|uniref:Uncharacterized protein n=1 Tax=Reticulomyxa filosa TaxID=46433 RepID=X6MPT6_RETFI|nr:hypothetical protein RFI_21669 [Reticulomyxa filosa]|eukprot:ETO15691.1 hypothetical protein RFI_21669 [Reticulomyxa filosa]